MWISFWLTGYRRQAVRGSLSMEQDSDVVLAVPKSNPIVDEFLKDGNELNLNYVDLSNTNNFFDVINAVKEEELIEGIEIFNMEHCKIGPKNIDLFYDAIGKHVDSSCQLQLSWNKLGEKGMVPIRKLFTPTINMTHLCLDGNDIGDMGMRSLMRALEVGESRIIYLSLSLNRIGKEGMKCFADKFPSALCCIAHLDLSKNDLSDASVANSVSLALGRSKTLRHVDLSTTRLGLDGGTVVSQNLICKNRYVKSIDLSNNNLRDGGAKAVCTALILNCVLETLRLGSNSIGASGCAGFVEAMSGNETLKTLDLSRTHSSQVPLGVEGARQIAHMLSVNQGLTELNLYWSQLESAGAFLLASALDDNKTIQKINLGGNFIGPSAVRRLEECMSPMYLPMEEEVGLSAWDSQVNCTPLFLNRKTRIASRRPHSAAPVMSRLGAPPPTLPKKKRDTAINVNSRKSVVMSRSNFVRPTTAKPAKLNIKELFAINPPSKPMKENRAILPAIQNSLDTIDIVLATGKHKVSPAKIFRQLQGS